MIGVQGSRCAKCLGLLASGAALMSQLVFGSLSEHADRVCVSRHAASVVELRVGLLHADTSRMLWVPTEPSKVSWHQDHLLIC